MRAIITTKTRDICSGWPAIIGIGGFSGAGKSELAKLLKTEYAGIKETSFAEPIRQFVGSLVGMAPHEFEGEKEIPRPELGGKSIRYAMQTLGTDWGRNMVSESLWVDSCIRRCKELNEANTVAIVSDVRFDNEAAAIKEAGGVVLWVVTPYGNKSKAVGGVAGHSSEAGISPAYIDCFIENNLRTPAMLDEASSYLDLLAKQQA